MRLNLGEEVPVIIHRDNIISDYDQIIDYVERTFTGGMLCPTGVDGVCHSSPLVSDTIFEPKQATESWAGLSVPPKKSQATLRTQMPSEPHASSRHPREGRGPDNPGQLGYCPPSPRPLSGSGSTLALRIPSGSHRQDQISQDPIPCNLLSKARSRLPETPLACSQATWNPEDTHKTPQNFRYLSLPLASKAQVPAACGRGSGSWDSEPGAQACTIFNNKNLHVGHGSTCL